MSNLSIKESDAFAYFEKAVGELCDKDIDKPELFPSFNSIKNRECYLDDLVEVANLAEDVLKKVRKRIEQVNIQQKEEIDKFDEQIKKLKQHNLEIAGKLTDISDSLEKANTSKELTNSSKKFISESKKIANEQPEAAQNKHLPNVQSGMPSAEIPLAPKLKQNNLQNNSQSKLQNKHEKHKYSSKDYGDILPLLDDSFSREILPISEINEMNLEDKLPEITDFESDWSIVTTQKHKKHKKRALGPYAQIYDTESMNLPIYKPVVVAGEYTIKAVVCNDWPEITEMLEGCMYYVAPADHFAIKLCGVMLHGNIGEIYTNERNPVKIKECKFGADCNKDNCEYYHDPLFSEGKKDIRNYIAGSFLYSPLTGFKPKSIGSRKIGSRSTIESDINRLDEYDIKLHRDQVMHDLLCCLLVPL